MPELLLEFLSEEIPARMQTRAAEDLKRLVCEELDEKGLGKYFSEARSFVTPRRLAFVIDSLPERQMDSVEVRRGPRADAPAQAIDGFKRSLPKGAKVEVRDTEKGQFHFAAIGKKGRATETVLPETIISAIYSFPWPKSMRWGCGKARWVRPIHSVLAIFNGKRLELERHKEREGFGGLDTLLFPSQTVFGTDTTCGHPFLAPKAFKVKSFADYKAKLKKAKVILDPAERRQKIHADAEKLAAKAGLRLKRDPWLLDEVAGLVEWPVARLGTIDNAFMELPPELLTTVMRHHQKYFALTDGKGRLAPRFVVVLNTETRDGGKAAVAGNERVLRARLADARFFWDQDRKRRLESRVGDLGGRVFHAKLGTVWDKVARITTLAENLARHCKADPADAARAATLAKADLSSGMVGEFPELQGIIGRYYAIHDGEKPAVADAIAEHYSPQGPNDHCPSKPVSVAVALADKIDTLVGFWSVGEKPTGSRDPFALRRAALGVIRLILENELTFSVRGLIEEGWKNYPNSADLNKLHAFQEDLRWFLFDRLKVHLRDKGTPPDLIDALFAGGRDDDLLRIVRKAQVLKTFLKTNDGENLLVAYKRANNIVEIESKKDKQNYNTAPDEGRFRTDEERELWRALNEALQESGSNLEMAQFEKAVLALARLRKPVDDLFDRVTVNVEEPKLRENRLKLLSQISSTMNRVAQFSEIQGGER